MSDHPHLWELVEDRAATNPDAVLAVDEGGRTLTARDLHDRAAATAAGLHALGVEPGTPVSWMLPTWLDAAVLVAALTRLGAVQNPILPMLGVRETRFITTQTAARLFVVPGTWRGRAYRDEADALAADRADLQVLVVDADHPLPTADPASLPEPPEDRA